MAKPHIVVVGAGTFGGWTALHLLRSGAGVTLNDALERAAIKHKRDAGLPFEKLSAAEAAR